MADVADLRNRLIIQRMLERIGHHCDFLCGKKLDDVRFNLEEGEREIRAVIQCAVDKHVNERETA